MDGSGDGGSPPQGSAGVPPKFNIASIYQNIRQKLQEKENDDDASGQSSDNEAVTGSSHDNTVVSGQNINNHRLASGQSSDSYTVVSCQSNDNTIAPEPVPESITEEVTTSQPSCQYVPHNAPTADGDSLAQRSNCERLQEEDATQIQMESSDMDASELRQTESTADALKQAGSGSKEETHQRPDDTVEKHKETSSNKAQKTSEADIPSDVIVIKEEIVDLSYERNIDSSKGSTSAVSHGNDYRLPMSDSDSDSDSSDMSSFSGAESDEGDFDRHNWRDRRKPLRTRGEIFPEELPPIKDLHISLPKETQLELLGIVTGIVGVLVVIESKVDLSQYSPLNDDSVLFYEDKTTFGEVFEIFGQCKAPSYTVRFNSPEDIEQKGIRKGLQLYFVPDPSPELSEITRYVFTQQLLKQKGSDASWKRDNEPPCHIIEYSDDEEEKRSKSKRKANRKERRAADSDSDEEKAEADSGSKKSDQNQETKEPMSQQTKVRRRENKNRRLEAKNLRGQGEAQKVAEYGRPIYDVPRWPPSSFKPQPQSGQQRGHLSSGTDFRLSSPTFTRPSLLGESPGQTPRFHFGGGPFSSPPPRLPPFPNNPGGGFVADGSFRFPPSEDQWGSQHSVGNQHSCFSGPFSQQFRPPSSDNEWGSHHAGKWGSFSSDGSSQWFNFGAGVGQFRPPQPGPPQAGWQPTRFQGQPQFHQYH